MPRNVRNFWITLDVDGSKTKVETGPRNKDGGFTMTILMREEGGISDNAVMVEGKILSNGNLAVMVGTRKGEDSIVLECKR